MCDSIAALNSLLQVMIFCFALTLQSATKSSFPWQFERQKSESNFLHSFFVNSSVTTNPSSQCKLNLKSLSRAVVALLSCKSRHSHVTSANMSSVLSLVQSFGVGGCVANEGPACIRQLGAGRRMVWSLLGRQNCSYATFSAAGTHYIYYLYFIQLL